MNWWFSVEMTLLLKPSTVSVSLVMSTDPVLTLLTVLGCLMRGLRSTSPRLPPGRGMTEPLGVVTGLPELDPGVLMEPRPEIRKCLGEKKNLKKLEARYNTL